MKQKILYGTGCFLFILAFIFMLIICGSLDSDVMTFRTGFFMAIADIVLYLTGYILIELNREEEIEWD